MNNMKYEIECIGEHGFVIANSINLTQDYEEILKKDIEMFINKYKEIYDNVQESLD